MSTNVPGRRPAAGRRGPDTARDAPGARPAPAAKQIRRSGKSVRPAACQDHQAAEQLARVVDDRRPPGRARSSADRGTGRGSARGERTPAGPPRRPPRARAADRSTAAGVASQVAGICSPAKPSAERRARSSQVRVRPADRCPGVEFGSQRGSPVVPGRQQRPGLVRRQILDAQRAGQAQHDPARSRRAGAPGRWSSGLTSYGGSPSRMQRPADQPGCVLLRPQGVDQLGRPEVLVNVDRRGRRHGVPFEGPAHIRAGARAVRRGSFRGRATAVPAAARISASAATQALATRCKSTCRREWSSRAGGQEVAAERSTAALAPNDASSSHLMEPRHVRTPCQR